MGAVMSGSGDGTSLDTPLCIRRGKVSEYSPSELLAVEIDAIKSAYASKGVELTSQERIKSYRTRLGRRVDVFAVTLRDSCPEGKVEGYFYVDITECAPLRAVRLRTRAEKPCRYCGQPSMPGEDTCYIHHQK